MVLRRNNAMMSAKLLEICQMFEMTQWDFESELRQFSDILPWEIIDKVEQRRLTFHQIREMDAKELGSSNIFMFINVLLLLHCFLFKALY